MLLPVINNSWFEVFRKGGKIDFHKVDDATGIKLHYELGHKQNMSGEAIDLAGGASGREFRDAPFYAEEYGGDPKDWVKKSSKSTYSAPDGTTFQTHWVESTKTRQRVDIKASNTIVEK